MQAQARSLMLLLSLVATATIDAQPQPGAIPENPFGDPAVTNTLSFTNRAAELRRRFRERTNAAAAAAAAARTNVNPVAAPGTPTGVDTNLATPPGVVTAPEVVVPQPQAAPGQPVPAFGQPGAVPVDPAATNQLAPPPGFGQPAGQVIPPPPGADTTTMPDPADNPIAAGLSPDEIIPAGAINVQGMALDQFFDIYSLYSGRTILRPYTLPGPAGLTLKAQTDLTRREVVEAMDGVLALNMITMIPVGDKFVKAVPSNLADKEGAEISTIPPEALPNAEQFVTRIVKLQTAKPSEIAPTLQSFGKSPTSVTPIDSNQTIILRDYASNVKRMLEIIQKVDVMPESDFSFEVIPIKYGKVTDIYATMSALISGTGGGGTFGTGAATAGGAAATGFGRGGGFGAGGMGRFGSSRGMGGGYGSQYGGGYRGGMGSGYGSQYGGQYYPQEVTPQELDLQSISPMQVQPAPSAGGAQGSFQQRLSQIVNRAANPEQIKILENANIVPDERSNKLLIFANKRDMAMITNIVAKVDVLLAQVLIEAIILEVRLEDSLNVGVSSVQYPRTSGKFTGAGVINNGQILGALTNFPSGTPQGFTYLGSVGDDFDVVVTAIAEDRSANVLSRPRMQTSHAIRGDFFIGETRPYVTGFTDYGGLIGGGLSSRSQVQERTIGLSLGVTPFITPEGMVVMEIEQTFETPGTDVIIDGNPVPQVNSRQISAMLTARSGDIIMLGGFITASKTKTDSGVPFLKDIPLLGALFRSRSKTDDRTELIVLMKATVLETPEAAAFLAESERRQLPGIRQAEREFTESEMKRMRKVDKSSRAK